MLETSTPSVASTEYVIVLKVQRRIGAWWKTSAKLLQRNGRGQRSAESACWFVISAVSVMKVTGARNAIAAAISSEWFATAIRKRRLRTARGAQRREFRRMIAVSTKATPSISIAIADA